jgi:CO/xanthine dehydrogenase FAD-binding subunit
VLGSVADRPIRCVESEKVLTSRSLDEAAVAEAVAVLPLDEITMESRLASAGYRKRTAPALAERALQAAFANCEGARS